MKYLKALFLSQQNSLHTLVNLIGGSVWVGNLISSANLLLETLLELRLSLLVLLDFLSQITAGDIDLSLNARVAGSWSLLDLLQKITEIAECVVNVVFDVVEVLTSSLVFLACAGIEELVLRLRKSAFSFGSEFPETIVNFRALVENAGSVVCLAHFYGRAVKMKIGSILGCWQLTIATVSGLNIVITLGLSGEVSRWLRRVIGVALLAVGVILAVATALLVAVVLLLVESRSVY